MMELYLRRFSILSAIFFFVGGLVSPLAQAQTNAQNSYVSPSDQDLTIKSIVLVPPTDNVGGIYSKPVADELRKSLDDNKQWSLSNYPPSLKIKTENLDESPQDVQQILLAAQSEAALATKITRGPRGTSIAMTLFVGRDGLPLLQETIVDSKSFETAQIREEALRLFDNLKSRMPFRGTILSRRGQQVTLNLGRNYGLKQDSRISIIQIVKINRHPKLNFLIGTDREVLGRVRLFKVERYLSFGYIEMEKDPGVISVGSKVMPDEFVKYSLPVVTPSGKVLQDVTTRPDKDVAFGDEPQEWLPTMKPQFGKIELMAGLANYTQNASLGASGSITGGSNLAPNILVRGEVWLNSEWYVGLMLRQAVMSIDNTLTGSSPGKLNLAVGQYGVNFGYNFLLTNDFFGPKLQFSGGYLNTNFIIDNSTPMAYTTMKYGGMIFSLVGQFPVSEDVPVDIGGKLDFFLTGSLSENKSSGGSSSNKINAFSFFADYRIKTRFKIRGELLLENYNSDFSGPGNRSPSASTISHRLTTLLGGVQYLF